MKLWAASLRLFPLHVSVCSDDRPPARFAKPHKLLIAGLAALLCAVAVPGADARRAGKLTESAPQQNAAAIALFVNSNLESARALAMAALRRNPADRNALLVQMEAAALAADTGTQLDAALRLCTTAGDENDPRLTIAGARVLDVAGNTSAFRAVIPRIRELVAAVPGKPAGRKAATAGMPQTLCANFLRTSLVVAAAEGAPGLALPELSHQAGIITEWKIAGPFGKYPNVAFDRVFAPERDGLAQTLYADATLPPSMAGSSRVAPVAAEYFSFDDGNVELPEYFSQAGIFYAAADVTTSFAGDYSLRVESAGTLDVFVDGTRVLQKDDRFHATPQSVLATVWLNSGRHRVLVKFLPSAPPFRIAMLPVLRGKQNGTAPGMAASRKRQARSLPGTLEAERDYIEAAERFWMGDYEASVRRLTALRVHRPSAAVDYLLAQAWSRSNQDSPEESALLQSALKESAGALAAEYDLAARAYSNGALEEALQRAQRVAGARPDYAPAQQLLANAAARLNWPDRAAQAYMAELRIRPVCDRLRSAARFFASIADFARAAELEGRLNGCAPGSLAYAEELSEQGRHEEAAMAAQKVVLGRPRDRSARALLSRELATAGKVDEAQRVAAELAALAPNSAEFRALASQFASGATVVNRSSLRGREFSGAQDFYTPYRRSGLEVIQKTAHRRFSGGPAVFLLQDQVARLDPSGSVAVYFHTITRVLNREGIEKYGEVALPRGAELLELRTIKQDGTIVEPEFIQNKNSVSMPALSAGDAIEQEYVIRHSSGGISQHPDAFRYTFGSFQGPILHARFIALTPACAPADCAGDKLQIIGSSGVPTPAVSVRSSTMVRVWEMENIVQTSSEVSPPKMDLLPGVRLLGTRAGGWPGLRDFYRNELIDAVRIGPRVEATAQALHEPAPEATARNLYRFVTTRLRSIETSFESGDLPSAESTLATFSGSRTAALLALGRAAGLDTELLLAREIAQTGAITPESNPFTHPLVRFRFGRKEAVADAEAEYLAFGVLPANLVADGALLVPLQEADVVRAENTGRVSGYPPALSALLAPLPPSYGDEHSVADGDITIDADGNLAARVAIRMGTSRNTQMRGILSGIPASERRQFFERLALRLFPGTTEADGFVRNEEDTEHPLELIFTCRAPHFLSFAAGTAEMEQLAPALGLRKMYGLGPRRLPLYVDTPLIETTVFHVHLPAEFKVTLPSSGVHLNTEFGSYTLEMRQASTGEVEVRRAFQVPVQIIPPERFEAFARFARQIDDAERQRIALARPASTTSARDISGSPPQVREEASRNQRP
jgi:tetratricopeptide (TPR) repeat protein